MKHLNILLGLALAAGSFSSCEMDFFPTNNIEQSQSFTSTADLKKHVTGLYNRLRMASSGEDILLGDLYTDLVHPTTAYGNRLGNFYSVTNATSSHEFSDPWEAYYLLLNNVNNVITNGPTVPLQATSADTLAFRKAMGEAHLMRAYAYTYLVTHFAKSYDASTASTDLGVPLKQAVDVNQRLPRSTVQETYDLILSDLAKTEDYWTGQTLTPTTVNKYKGSPSELTTDVLNALKARVYLEMDNYAAALAAAQAVINTGNYPLITNATDFAKMWASDQGTEIIMHAFISTNELPNTISQYLGAYTVATGRYQPDFIPQQWVLDAYESADIRKGVYFAQFPLELTTTFTNLYSINKYPRTTEFSASGDYSHSPLYFRVSEMYLIAAEAAVQNGDAATALTYINAIRTARGLTALTAVTLTDVQAERLREMLGEGNRLADLKRWGLGIARGAAQNVTALTPNSLNLNLPAGHDRMVWPIPAYDMGTNSNLVQNPGW